MLKLLISCLALFFYSTVYSQSFNEKQFPLPVSLRNIQSLSKEGLVLSPDGHTLCIMRESAPYRAYLVDMATGKITDSIEVDSFKPEIHWSGDSRRLCFSRNGYPDNYFLLYSRDGKLIKKITSPLPVLNFQLDSTATTIVAAQYKPGENGSHSEYDLYSASVYPKGEQFNYRITKFDIASGLVTDSLVIKTTYPRIEGQWNKLWLALCMESEAEFQSVTSLYAIDFSQKKVEPIANSKDLFHNIGLMNIRTLTGTSLYLGSSNLIQQLSANQDKFNPVLNTAEIESIGIGDRTDGKQLLIAGLKGRRWAENKIWLSYKNQDATSIDIMDFIPHLVCTENDSAFVISFSENNMRVRSYAINFKRDLQKPQVLIQNSINADHRFIIPETDFLLEYNSQEWQVTNLSSQLISYQDKNKESFGAKFIPLGNQRAIIKYTGTVAELISVDNWNEVSTTLSLSHPMLKDGNSVYSQLASLSDLVYNPATGLLAGLFYSSNSYFVSAWDLSKSPSPAYVVKLERNKIPFDKSSFYESTGPAQILLTHLIFGFGKTEWATLTTEKLLKQLKQLKGRLSASIMEKLGNFQSYSGRYEIAMGKLTDQFVYQDSIYGNYMIDLNEPSESVYFCHKSLTRAFPGFKYIPYTGEGFGINRIDLSDKGNFVSVSNLGSVRVVELRTGKNKMQSKNFKESYFDGNGYLLLESKGILVGQSAWYDENTLRPLYTKMKTLFTDSALYIPGKQTFIASLTGNRGYLEIKLDRLLVSQKKKTLYSLLGTMKSDSVQRFFSPEKKFWMMAGEDGIGYDSSAKARQDVMGRLFPSALNDRINFVQFFPAENKVMIGNSSESSFEFWDLLKEELLFRLVLVDEKNFFIQSASGYYYATPNALQQLCFVQEKDPVPASFLDGSLNRPDLVLTDMYGTTDTSIRTLVAIYKKAALRKNSTGLTIIPGLSPIIKMASPENTLQTEPGYALKFSISAGKAPVTYFSVLANNVLIWDTSFTNPVQQLSLVKNIRLISGENQLVCIARDREERSSVPVFQRILYQPVSEVKSVTYIVAIGVNNYADTEKNLKYAVKDGKDMLAAFRDANGETVITDSLFDSDVTLKNIRKLREKLLKTTAEDKVVISFSGHGMLDDKSSFYLATYDMDFLQPQKNGCAFSELEELLAGIPARKKLLLMDACHSGNVEKEETITEEEQNILSPHIARQSDTTHARKGLGVTGDTKLSLQQVIGQLFASSSTRSGTEVIAATAGDAFAYEAPEWNNGVFTYAVLKAFRDSQGVDLNFDDKISIRELKRFVYATVTELTGGKQQPLSRYENPNYDWDLLPFKQ